MNCAIVFIKNQKELDLAKSRIFDKHLIDYSIKEISHLDLDKIYLVGSDFEVKGTISRDSINEVIEEVENIEGKCLLMSPFYPLIDKKDYKELLEKEASTVLTCENEIVPVFTLKNDELSDFEAVQFEGVELSPEKNRRFTGIKDIYGLSCSIKEKINNHLLENGVIILDPTSTIIGIDVVIDKKTVIESNTEITGKCLIGKNNKITKGSTLRDVILGDNNVIVESRIENSIVHNNVNIGPNAIIEDDSEIFDEAKVGSYVKLSKTKIGQKSSVDHMSYLGDCEIMENVKIGSGVLTVNTDGLSRHSTIIKANATVGCNVTLIAPLLVGEYALLAAGSTIDSDVRDGDMAISRLYQQNKKGYGYKYFKED
ncbi:MAG: hypothetical protein Q4B60_01795 [Erysipelotrichaceae bacterium]|nr:hypothetical protein [Erysipelotrichaceae bacterium]